MLSPTGGDHGSGMTANTNHGSFCFCGGCAKSIQDQLCSFSVYLLYDGKKLHRSTSADIKLNVLCFYGLACVSLCLQFTVASYKIQLFFQLSETLEGFWQVPSMQEMSLFSNSQI